MTSIAKLKTNLSTWKLEKAYIEFHMLVSWPIKFSRNNSLFYGYYKVSHTSGLWKHHTLSIQFLLIVDDFGINKSTNKMKSIY